MKGFFSFSFFGIALALSIITCPVYCEESPLLLVSISGNTSVITTGADETFQFSVDDVDPNTTVIDTNQTRWIIPLEKILPEESVTAAIILTGTDGNESVFMVRISDPLYSAENKTLSGTGHALKYYDGTILADVAQNQSELHAGTFGKASIRLESPVPVPLNSNVCLDCTYEPPKCLQCPDGCAVGIDVPGIPGWCCVRCHDPSDD